MKWKCIRYTKQQPVFKFLHDLLTLTLTLDYIHAGNRKVNLKVCKVYSGVVVVVFLIWIIFLIFKLLHIDER